MSSLVNKYPVYIVSKGRWENPLTAKMFLADGVDFRVLVEPQEADKYASVLGENKIEVLPFSNLGLGSFPARNHAWKLAIENGFDRHWLFDDNIRNIKRLNHGNRVNCNALTGLKMLEDFTDRYSNIGISAFNYEMFVLPKTKKPFQLNCHCYSVMLIKNDMPFRWRLKYNEDVDLCLQVLHNGLCTVLFNAIFCYKVSTTAKMKGGNQDELYKGNSFDKKVLKARSLEEMWPNYCETTMKYGRPHHHVDWKKHFKHKLIRRDDIDFSSLPKTNNYGLKLTNVTQT